jgi:glycosyltransferase involved in cell wall biosynthesis
MKVIFIMPYPVEIASTRQRVFQFFPYLTMRGVQCFPSSFISSEFHKILYSRGRLFSKIGFTLRGFTRRFVDLKNIADFDVAFIHREAFPFYTTVIESMISKKVPIIYDFDDSIFLMNPTKPSLVPFLRKPSKVAKIIELSKCVITGNVYLADYAKRYNSNVHVIPTCIDTEYYTPALTRRKSHNTVVIGWIGSRSTIPYLAEIRQTLINLSKKYDFVVKVVSNENFEMGFPTIFKKWRLEEELTDLRSFDIGIMPLPDNKWTRGKCGYKIIQYMSVGKPVVATSVGVNREIIRDGHNGFLANGAAEWEDKLARLIECSRMRETFGRRGRGRVEELYSVGVNAPKLLTLLRLCVG